MLGKHPAPIDAQDLTGQDVHITFDDGKTRLIYFVDPDCGWCRANASAFRTLSTVAQKSLSVIVMTKRTEHLDKFLEETRIPKNEILVIRATATMRDLDLIATPQTFLIAGNGEILSHWTGAYDHQNKKEIEKRFGVKLPDINDPTSSTSAS